MEAITKVVQISQFFSVCVQLCHQAAKIIHNTKESGDLGEVSQGYLDPMTKADLMSQTLIMKGLRKFWPNLKLIGEEDKQYEGQIDFNFNTLNKYLIPEELYQKGSNNVLLNNQFDCDKVVVWIDPLDGTLSYVNNQLDAVTTLIGVSYLGFPLMGIIGSPYQSKSQGKYEFDPRVYFGHIDSKQVYYYKTLEKILDQHSVIPYEVVKKIKPNDQFIITTSSNRVKQTTLDFLQTLKPTKMIRTGGSGQKSLQVLQGVADSYIYVGEGTKQWDTCAGEALISIMGGKTTNLVGNPHTYHTGQKDSFVNFQGLLVTLDPQLHKKLVESTQFYPKL